MKTTNPIDTERALRFYLATRGTGDYQQARRLVPLPRWKAKQGKQFCAAERAKHADKRSMMHSHHPAGMKPVIQQDDRSKMLFIAYRRRIKARPKAASFDR